MVKKPNRQDCERRARQSARLGRLLRLLILLSGRGRWNIESLADELECSSRTVYRLLDALTACGVPWYLDRNLESYKVRDGFKLGRLTEQPKKTNPESAKFTALSDELLQNGKKFKESLDAFLRCVESLQNSKLE